MRALNVRWDYQNNGDPLIFQVHVTDTMDMMQVREAIAQLWDRFAPSPLIQLHLAAPPPNHDVHNENDAQQQRTLIMNVDEIPVECFIAVGHAGWRAVEMVVRAPPQFGLANIPAAPVPVHGMCVPVK